MSKREKSRPTKPQKKSDPNFVLKVAVGPPLASLVPQAPGSGLTLGSQFCYKETRFIWKTDLSSADDNRLFDATGRLMAVSYHYGKNPYETSDAALGIPTTGEWDSICYIGGYNGMPDLKVRPKTFSLHGRQYIRDASGETTFCNVATQSKNFAVFAGEKREKPVYTILVNMAGRTMQVMNNRDEKVALLEKSVKPLLLNARLGVGSEFTVDVAAGVDWTAMLAVVIGLQQVGKSIFEDAFNNFLLQPLQDEVTAFAEDAVAQAIEEHNVENDGEDGGDGYGDGDGGGAVVAEEMEVEEEGGSNIVSSIIGVIGGLFE